MNSENHDAESVSQAELKAILNRNLVPNSTIGNETVNGVYTETRTVTITPSLAETLLTRNTTNRPITNGNVTKLIGAMKNGEWVFDGTPISFDRYGKLLNGQHRLNAVVKSGVANIFKVSTGFNPEIFSTMDIGKIRTGSEILAIAGVENYNLCAQTANFVFKFLRGSISMNASKPSRHVSRPNSGLSHPELLKFIEVKPLIKESVSFYVQNKKKQQPMSLMPTYMISGLHFLFSEKDSEMAETFLIKLMTGEGLTMDSPIYVLRNRLLNSKTDKSKRLLHNESVKLTILAWNKFRNGSKAKNLQIPDNLPVIA